MIYKKVLNQRLINNSGKPLPMPITIVIYIIITTLVIILMIIFVLVQITTFSKSNHIPNLMTNYEYHAYEDTNPDIRFSTFLPYLDIEESISGYELAETNEAEDFIYYLYINNDTKIKLII